MDDGEEERGIDERNWVCVVLKRKEKKTSFQ